MLIYAATAATGQNTQVEPDDYRNWSVLALPVTGYSPDLGVILGGSAILMYGPDIGVPDEIATGAQANTASLIAMYTTHGSFVLGGGVQQYLADDRWLLNGRIGFSKTPSEYWGTGPGTKPTDNEEYTADSYSIQLGAGWETVTHLYLGLRMTYQYYALSNLEVTGELHDMGLGTGITDPYTTSGHFSTLGTWLRYDSTEGNSSPYRGNKADVELKTCSQAWNCTMDFSLLTINLRQYRRIFRSHVLALQAVYRQGFGSIPFFELPDLGGSTFRGYASGRFRDAAALSLQTEYRIPLPGRFGLVGFVGIGQVGPTPADMFLSAVSAGDIKIAGGAGLRFRVGNIRQGLNIRLDGAVSPEGFKVYINAGEAF
ncbi:MAG: BamA/TamA family outer membrane protein, partial [Spirochaeta sp.]